MSMIHRKTGEATYYTVMISLNDLLMFSKTAIPVIGNKQRGGAVS